MGQPTVQTHLSRNLSNLYLVIEFLKTLLMTTVLWSGLQKQNRFSHWSKDLIPWHGILLLLEGETVKLPASKSIYNEDTVISIDVAIFATSENSIMHKYRYMASDDS